MKETYDRLAAGDRIRLKRTLLGLTQEEMAEKINRATKYYADIERGSCGMSIETLMGLSTSLDMSLDYIIYGKTSDEKEEKKNREETTAIIGMLDSSDIRTRQYALNMLKLLFAACKER
ncbi:MAG: helix-turn-helix transcriptional regulator [Lachnospiraceae bacterium]|nr:helix-turn-helix transcriptional regulator [Lachnospiraceae bacterium]